MPCRVKKNKDKKEDRKPGKINGTALTSLPLAPIAKKHTTNI